MSPKESDKISTAYKTERKKLLGYIRNRIPDRLDAEDILQDVFYQLTLGFRDLDRIQNLTAWLYRVTENRIIDRFRKKKPVSISYTEATREGEDGPLTLEEILPSLGSDPEDEDIKEMIWETIGEVLDNMPAEQRDVFVSTEFDDLSFREISEKTGIGINTLISRKRYAVLELRSKLEELYKLLKNK
jgi:RNA polymerase sigma factor (sigma-70 family)